MRFFLFLLLTSLPVFALAQRQDSLFQSLKIYKKPDSTRLNMLLQLATEKLSQDISQADSLLSEAYQTSLASEGEIYLAAIYNLKGIVYRRKNDYDTAQFLFDKAYQTSMLAGDTLRAANSLYSQANMLKSLNQTPKAFMFYEQTSKLYKHQKNLKGESLSIKGMADVLLYQKDTRKALSYYQAALSILPKNEVRPRSVILSNIGAAYLELNNTDSARFFTQAAIQIKQKINDQRGLASAYLNLASAFIQQNSADSAIKYQQAALRLYEQFGNKENIALALNNLTSYNITRGNIKAAQGYSARAINIAYELKNSILLEQSYRRKYQLDSAQGNDKSALQSLKKQYIYRDSIFSSQKQKTIAELEARFKANQQAAEIKDLSQQGEIQKLQLQQKNQWLLMGGIFLLLILAIGVAAYYRSLRRQAATHVAKAEIEQRFLRSQLSPHFIFNALSTIQSYVLKQNASLASKYISQFAKLMRQVLETSREAFIPLEEEIDMLENYLALQKLQAAHTLNYEIIVDKEVDTDFMSIPPMFVQPFVENALVHGLIDQQGKITIHFQVKQDMVGVKIIDNGIGLSATMTQKSKDSQKHKSLATLIIKERIASYNLQLNTNISISLKDIMSPESQINGTEVILWLPYANL